MLPDDRRQTETEKGKGSHYHFRLTLPVRPDGEHVEPSKDRTMNVLNRSTRFLALLEITSIAMSSLLPHSPTHTLSRLPPPA